jgi:hypothetical protein
VGWLHTIGCDVCVDWPMLCGNLSFGVLRGGVGHSCTDIHTGKQWGLGHCSPQCLYCMCVLCSGLLASRLHSGTRNPLETVEHGDLEDGETWRRVHGTTGCNNACLLGPHKGHDLCSCLSYCPF